MLIEYFLKGKLYWPNFCHYGFKIPSLTGRNTANLKNYSQLAHLKKHRIEKYLFWDSQKCLRQCRCNNNLQGIKFDYFHIKIWKARVNGIHRRFYCINISWFASWTKSKQMYINAFQSLLFFSTRSDFIGWSCKLKVHRANCQMISSFPVRFPTDIVNNNKIFFLHFLFGFFYFSTFFSFFCFLFLCVFFWFETKNIYSDTHSTMQAGKWWKNIHPADFRKQDNFFLA